MSKHIQLFTTATFVLSIYSCQIDNERTGKDVFIMERESADSTCNFDYYVGEDLNENLKFENCKELTFNTLPSDGENGLQFNLHDGFLELAFYLRNGQAKGLDMIFNKNGRPEMILYHNENGNIDGYKYEFNEDGRLSAIYKYDDGVMKGLVFRRNYNRATPPFGDMTAQDSIAWRVDYK